MAAAEAACWMTAFASSWVAQTCPKTVPPAAYWASPTRTAMSASARPTISLTTTSTTWETAVGDMLRIPS